MYFSDELACTRTYMYMYMLGALCILSGLACRQCVVCDISSVNPIVRYFKPPVKCTQKLTEDHVTVQFLARVFHFEKRLLPKEPTGTLNML